MSIQLKSQKVRLNSKNVKQIYFESFPKSERMPFPMMVAMSKLWNTQFLSFYDDDTLCGFVYFATNRKLVFVMFFAVAEKLRSKGYGSTILQKIHNRYPNKKIVVSIEPCDTDAPDLEIRKRRKAFYLRNGYKETGYMLKLNRVVQEIIITGGCFVKKEFRTFFTLYSNGTMWPKIWKYKE